MKKKKYLIKAIVFICVGLFSMRVFATQRDSSLVNFRKSEQHMQGFKPFGIVNAKIKIGYITRELNFAATAYLSMKKDAVLYLQVRGLLGILLFQVWATPDTVVCKSNLDHKVYSMGKGGLTDLLGVPISFAALQQIFMGFPPFSGSEVLTDCSLQQGDTLKAAFRDGYYIHNVTCGLGAGLVYKSASHSATNPTFDLYLSNGSYKNTGNGFFPYYRSLLFSGRQPSRLEMDFAEVSFDKSLRYAF